jgi:hypothetical protein
MVGQAVRLATEIASYERAAAVFQDLTHLPLSKSTLHRLTRQAGSQVAVVLATEAQAAVHVPGLQAPVVWRTPPTPASPVMNVSSDGVLIRLRHEGFKEVKVVAVSAVEQTWDEKTGATQVHLTQHSYRAGLWDATTFASQVWAESERRGLTKAQQLVSVNDGAPWIWAIVFLCFARCIEILDWYHATQRLWTIATTAFATDPTAATAWVETQKQHLAQSQLRPLFHNIRVLYPHRHACPEAVLGAVRYLFAQRTRMDYHKFRQAGYPIGSGVIESACKLVVQARLKQAGMQWSRPGAQAMLALRSVLLSDRWHLLTNAVNSS